MEHYNLPKESFYEVLLNADYQTILTFCQTSSSISQLCRDDYFWQLKMQHDFPHFDKLLNRTWKKSYVLLLQSEAYLNNIKEAKDEKDEDVYIKYNITNINFFNDIKQDLPIDETLQKPTRIIIWMKNNEYYIEYDEPTIFQRQPRRVDEAIMTIIRYNRINEYLISYDEALQFIYILFNYNIIPQLIEGVGIPVVEQF
jgi:hypothetical protein